MKLAEALMERKETKARIESLKKRLYRSAQSEDGVPPAEPPAALLVELEHEIAAFERLVARINLTNATARFDDGYTLADVLIQRDMTRLRHLVLSNLADHAVAVPERYSQRELRNVPAIDVAETRRAADRAARDGRLLDARIQRLNWEIDLVTG